MYLVLYEFYKTKTKTLSATWAAWMFAVAMVGAPWLFNPQCFSFTNIKASAEEIQHWLLGKVRVRELALTLNPNPNPNLCPNPNPKQDLNREPRLAMFADESFDAVFCSVRVRVRV